MLIRKRDGCEEIDGFSEETTTKTLTKRYCVCGIPYVSEWYHEVYTVL